MRSRRNALAGSRRWHASFGALADIAADLAVMQAFTAAELAAIALRYKTRFVMSATLDYNLLRRLALGSYPQAGEPIDPSPKGPLGPLWRKVNGD